MDFDDSAIQFVSSLHAEERLVERGNHSWEEARSAVVELARTSELLIEVDDHRYLKNGEFYLPCVRHRYLGSNVYVVKSVLTWDMVDYRLQNIIDNYHLSGWVSRSAITS